MPDATPKFYDEPRYKQAHDIIAKHSTGYCLDQIPLPHGGVLEKWNVNCTVILLLAEFRPGTNAMWLIDVYAPVTGSLKWEDLDKALAEIAAKPRS